MAFTEADLASLRSAIAKGEKTVMFADRSTTYRSIAELVAAAAVIEASLATRSKQSLAYAEKGL